MKVPAPDHYTTLGVPRDASHKEIRRARNRLLRRHHPDLNPGSEAESKARTIAILLAAKVLLDDDARREYDRTYRYVHGTEPSERSSPPAAESAPDGVDCERCGRMNSWRRAYCLYCGAGIGGAPDGVHVDEALFEEDGRFDRSTTIVHFGCGSVVGLVVAMVFGFRAFAFSGLESLVPFVVVSAAAVLATGAAAAKLKDEFWYVLLQFFAIFVIGFMLLFTPFMLARETGFASDGTVAVLLVSALSLGAGWFAFRGRWREYIVRIRGRRSR
jgi:hypothetical protein